MGGSSKSQTVGYRYLMGLHFGLCQGPVDAFLELRGGDRTAWAGNVTESGSIEVDAPDLWGGEKKEGGIQGTLDVMMGEPTQAPNDYLVSQLGTPMPAFRGMLSTVFRKGMVGAMNPYPKPWKFKLRRILKGWSGGEAWYPEKAPIPFLVSAPEVPPWVDDDEDPRDPEGEFEYRCKGYVNSPPYTSWQGTWVDSLDAAIAEAVGFGASAGAFTHLMGWSPDGERLGRAYGLAPGDAATLFLHYNRYAESHAGLSYESVMSAGDSTFVCGPMVAAGVEPDSGRFWWSMDTGAGPGIERPNTPGLHRLVTRDPITGIAPLAEGEHGTNNCGQYAGVPVSALSPDSLIEVRRVAVSHTSYAMNPAHIVYQALTDPEWGMGYPPGALDLDSFTEAADVFYAEGLGLCGQWTRQDTIEGFIQDMVNHAGAVLAQNPVTGLFQLLPIRGDYAVEDLPEFRRGLNVQGVELFERAALTETVNEVTVQYIDASTGKDGAVTLQHLANIQAQGGVVSQTVRYPFCPTQGLAQRLALRDLTSRASPLCKVRLVCDRSAYGVVPGRVIRWTDAKLGIVDMPMRVLNVDSGTIGDGAIRLDLAEDVFGMPATTYMGQQEGGWVEPDGAPKPSPLVAAMELPYVVIHRATGASAAAALDPESGLLGVLAAKPEGLSYGYALHARAGAAEFAEVGSGEWAASGILAEAIGPTDTTLELGALVNPEEFVPGALGMIGTGEGAELVRIDSAATGATTITVGRGVGDTLPPVDGWPVGSRVWIVDANVGLASVEYVAGEEVDARVSTSAPTGSTPVASAPGDSATMAQRAFRPYPPAGLEINGEAYPTEAFGALALTWLHRDRLLQADQLVDQGAASIGPEPGTTYTVRYYLDDVLEETELGITGTASTPYTLSGNGVARVEVEAVRDAIASWQVASAEFDYLTAPPASRITDAGNTRITDSGNRRLTD